MAYKYSIDDSDDDIDGSNDHRDSFRDTLIVIQLLVISIYISHFSILFILFLEYSPKYGIYISFLEPLQVKIFPYLDTEVFKWRGRVGFCDQVTFFSKNLSFVF